MSLTSSLKKTSLISNSNEALKHIAERLKIARRSKHITLEEMAANLGITRKQLQNYENAKSNMTISRLWEISNLLDIETGFFVEGLNPGKPFIANEDLKILNKLHNIKDKKIKASIIGILNEL